VRLEVTGMKRVFLLTMFVACTVGAAAQGDLPVPVPQYMHLSSADEMFEVDWVNDVMDPDSREVVWTIDFDVWSQERVVLHGFETHPKTEDSRKYLMMVGTHEKGDNYVVLHAVIFDGDECVRKQYILKWDPPDSD
jgi:hypothetical protein